MEQLRAEMQRAADIHRTSLRKSEFLFEREYAAASALVELSSRIDPGVPTGHPNFQEAVEYLFRNVREHWLALVRFQEMHGAILDETAKKFVQDATEIAAFLDSDAVDFDDASTEVALVNMCDLVRRAASHMVLLVRNQAAASIRMPA